ncbi:phosphoribosyltransferase family protein [Modestobacter lacusdianchii]
MPARPHRRDLYASELETVSGHLAKAVRDFEPDLIVGIETGGARVAESMLEQLPGAAYIAVRLQRPATRLKSRLRLGSVVSRLPRRVADAARWLEVEVRESALSRRPAQPEVPARDLLRSTGLSDAAATAERILVVDDTIDSGRTLTTVAAAAAMARPTAEVRTAVLASAWRNPPVRADYCLFDHTLLRLPSSLDATPPA